MDERIFQIILALIPVLGAIITYFVIPLLKEKIGTEKLIQYKEWTTLAVKAAEMLWTESGMGADKKQFVIDYLNKIFNEKKIVITEEQLNVLIEAAVQELNKDKK
jgi:LL-H family phage holin